MKQGAIGMVAGMKVYVNPNLPRFKIAQFRFPRSKGKRIRLKWAKQLKNSKQVPIKTAYIFNGNIVMHPADFEKLSTEGATVKL